MGIQTKNFFMETDSEKNLTGNIFDLRFHKIPVRSVYLFLDLF